MLFGLDVPQIEIDELWGLIGKKQRRVLPSDPPSFGDACTFLGIAVPKGKRDGDNARAFLADLRGRVVGSPILPGLRGLVAEIFGNQVHYGQIAKRYVGEPHKDAARRYSPGVVVAVEKSVKIGFPPEHMIGTSRAERLNLSVRMGRQRFTRLTNAYSKSLEHHRAAVSLFVCHYNFCRVHETLRVTPAMELNGTYGVADVDADRWCGDGTGTAGRPARGAVLVIDGGGNDSG